MNIFLIIAGSYTPIAIGSLRWDSDAQWYQSGEVLLITIWCLAISGLILNLVWLKAPRFVSTAVYIILGLAAVVWLPAVVQFGGPYGIAVVSLIGAGGVFYITGAVFYAIKNPLRNAKIFGFHELFHCCTLAAFICHTVAIYLSLLN